MTNQITAEIKIIYREHGRDDGEMLQKRIDDGTLCDLPPGEYYTAKPLKMPSVKIFEDATVNFGKKEWWGK